MAQNFLSDIQLGDNISIRLGDATNGDLQIFHDSAKSMVRNYTGNLLIDNFADDADIIFRSDDGSGGVATYYTIDGGVGQNVFSKDIVAGDNVYLRIGNATDGDLQIYHNGSDSYIKDAGTGDLKIVSSVTKIYDADMSHFQATFTDGGSVDLYYAGNKKFETTNTGVSVTGAMTASGEVTAFSDERLKSNIETLDGSKVYNMRGVSFTKDDKVGSGVIAQELEKVAPELVNNDNEYKSVAYGNITGYLIEAIKDLKAEIEELKKCECKNCNCK